MTLVALTTAAPIAAAYTRFCRHFEPCSEILDRTVTNKAGTEPAKVRWYAELGFWARIVPQSQATGFLCGFGVDNPLESEALTFTCEINPVNGGVDRLRAGVFVRSDNGTIYLAHSGCIAGGRPGIGRTKFLKFYGMDTVDDVYWPDKQMTENIIIGALDDTEFLEHVAAFVHRVAEFKRL